MNGKNGKNGNNVEHRLSCVETKLNFLIGAFVPIYGGVVVYILRVIFSGKGG